VCVMYVLAIGVCVSVCVIVCVGGWKSRALNSSPPSQPLKDTQHLQTSLRQPMERVRLARSVQTKVMSYSMRGIKRAEARQVHGQRDFKKKTPFYQDTEAQKKLKAQQPKSFTCYRYLTHTQTHTHTHTHTHTLTHPHFQTPGNSLHVHACSANPR